MVEVFHLHTMPISGEKGKSYHIVFRDDKNELYFEIVDNILIAPRKLALGLFLLGGNRTSRELKQIKKRTTMKTGLLVALRDGSFLFS